MISDDIYEIIEIIYNITTSNHKSITLKKTELYDYYNIISPFIDSSYPSIFHFNIDSSNQYLIFIVKIEQFIINMLLFHHSNQWSILSPNNNDLKNCIKLYNPSSTLKLQILKPLNNSNVDCEFTLFLNGINPLGFLFKIYVDGKYLSKYFNYNHIIVRLHGFKKGVHSLKIKLYDQHSNKLDSTSLRLFLSRDCLHSNYFPSISDPLIHDDNIISNDDLDDFFSQETIHSIEYNDSFDNTIISSNNINKSNNINSSNKSNNINSSNNINKSNSITSSEIKRLKKDLWNKYIIDKNKFINKKTENKNDDVFDDVFDINN